MIIHERVSDIMAKVQIRKLFVHEFVMKFIIHRFKHVFGSSKCLLIEMVLLSTHNMIIPRLRNK